MDSYHCQEYGLLTLEEKILVDEEMKKWFVKFANTCVPAYIFKVAEERLILEMLKEKNDRRDRK